MLEDLAYDVKNYFLNMYHKQLQSHLQDILHWETVTGTVNDDDMGLNFYQNIDSKFSD